MNKILLIAAIITTIGLGVAICYYMNLAPAVELVDNAKTFITEKTSGIDTTLLMGAGGTAITTAVSGIAVSQFNQKKAAITQSISSSNLAKEAQAQVNDLKTELTQTTSSLTTQTEQYRTAAEKALAEAEASKTAQSAAEAEVKRLQSQIDGLHELIPDMKDKDLTSIVQKALRVP